MIFTFKRQDLQNVDTYTPHKWYWVKIIINRGIYEGQFKVFEPTIPAR